MRCSKRLRRTLIAGFLAILSGTGVNAAEQSDFFAGENFTDLQLYRAYPHVDRGLREQRAGRLRNAEESFNKALAVMPSSVHVRLALAQVLHAQGRYADADSVLAPIRNAPGVAAVLYNIRTTWLARQKDLPSTTLQSWLNDCSAEWCSRYAEAIAGTFPPDLDTASFLMVEAGAWRDALQLLSGNLPFPADNSRTALTQRLIELYQAHPEAADEEALTKLSRVARTPAQTDSIAELWRTAGRCDRSRQLIEASSAPSPQGNLILGHCYRDSKPGLAIHYFEKALPAAPVEMGRALAYLYSETGQHEKAFTYWSSLPPSSMQRNDWLAAAREAIAAGKTEQARDAWERAGTIKDREWNVVGALIGESMADRALARRHWEEAHRLAPDAQSSYALGRLASSEGDKASAISHYRAAVEADLAQNEYKLALGFALVSEQPAEAAALLEQAAPGAGARRFPVLWQIGYARAQLGDNEPARRVLRAALDESQDYLSQLPSDEAADRSFALRRTHESLTRRWSFGLNSWIASGSVPGELVAQRANTAQPRHYTEGNFEARLGDEPINHDRFIAAIGRVGVEGDQSQHYPDGHGLLGLGLRWKPLSAWNVYFSAEAQKPLSSGQSDLMLRSTASFLDDNEYRGDWHAGGTGWVQRELYLDAAKWLRADRYDVLARYTHGYNMKLAIASASALYSYVFGQAERRTDGKDSRVGVGIAVRRWSGDDVYNAYRQHIALRLEWQQEIKSDLASKGGWFLKFESGW